MFEPLYKTSDHQPDHAEARWFFVKGNEVLVTDGLAGSGVPEGSDVADLRSIAGAPQVLGRREGATYWAAALPADFEAPAGYRLSGLRGLFGILSDDEWNAGGRATQVMDWVRDHQFCGRCGEAMVQVDGERSMKCPNDGNVAYPRLSPAVIMLITRDDGRALLGRSGLWDVPMYSTLAGFVEPGETLEETVHREIHEEVAVKVDNVTYFGSQSWPFPNSLMLGFTAEWAGGDIQIDGVEIADAQWFRPDDLPMIPPRHSIARRLIDSWLEA